MSTLIIWYARVRRDMLLTTEQVEIFDLEIAPIVPQNRELLLAREMIKVIEFDHEEFAIISVIVAALQHESIEAHPPGFSEAILFALPTTGCSRPTDFRVGVSFCA